MLEAKICSIKHMFDAFIIIPAALKMIQKNFVTLPSQVAKNKSRAQRDREMKPNHPSIGSSGQ